MAEERSTSGAWTPRGGHVDDLGGQGDEEGGGGRRNSVSRMLHRIRSGSLPGWIFLGKGGGGGGGEVEEGSSTGGTWVGSGDSSGESHLTPPALPFSASTDSSPLTPHKEFSLVPAGGSGGKKKEGKKGGKALLDPTNNNSRRKGNHNLGMIVSALYGKLLVVMGIAFPMAEVISTYIPPSFYDGFYLYLYFGSITFMVCVYGNMLRQKATRSVRCTIQRISTMRSKMAAGHGSPTPPPPTLKSNINHPSSDSEGECASGSVLEHNPKDCTKFRINYGSFYLRMGAVAFGIGSMIYSGLEFGQYFELEPDTKCHNFMIALTPAVRMMFTFMQMYFIFLNSKTAVYQLQFSNFGLMHMIGTNLCVWLNVLVQETRHEILMFYNPGNGTLGGHHAQLLTVTNSSSLPALRVRRGLKGPYSFLECRRSDIMGSLVQNASPFLFPCTIEHSLICAAILYVMWKSMAKMYSRKQLHGLCYRGDMYGGTKRSPHHYSVDCARANKGLFLGIFVLVMTIISLILFFVLVARPATQALAVLEVNITELVLYSMTTVGVLVGMCQMRELRYVRSRNLELDSILLIVAQTGSFIYNVFTIIGGHFTMKKNTALVLITALASLIQVLFQTLFILDASKRSAVNSEQARRKPGREVVTFLLVTNLAMWSINTLEKSRADSHPVQLKFYGVWAWTIITHISMPLAIFYRFHSTVCLCEIWKRAYKIKPHLYH